jgi:hypothetical protein
VDHFKEAGGDPELLTVIGVRREYLESGRGTRGTPATVSASLCTGVASYPMVHDPTEAGTIGAHRA